MCNVQCQCRSTVGAVLVLILLMMVLLLGACSFSRGECVHIMKVVFERTNKPAAASAPGGRWGSVVFGWRALRPPRVVFVI